MNVCGGIFLPTKNKKVFRWYNFKWWWWWPAALHNCIFLPGLLSVRNSCGTWYVTWCGWCYDVNDDIQQRILCNAREHKVSADFRTHTTALLEETMKPHAHALISQIHKFPRTKTLHITQHIYVLSHQTPWVWYYMRRSTPRTKYWLRICRYYKEKQGFMAFFSPAERKPKDFERHNNNHITINRHWNKFNAIPSASSWYHFNFLYTKKSSFFTECVVIMQTSKCRKQGKLEMVWV